MKQTHYLFILIIFIHFPVSVYAQSGKDLQPNWDGSYITNDPGAWELREIGGDIKTILNEKVLNLEFDYSEITVEGIKYTEEEYIAKMMEKYNKKSAGKGDEWRDNWMSARKNFYEPAFISSINETLEKQGLSVKQNASDAKYTIVLSLKTINPYKNELTKENSSAASFVYKVYETKDRTMYVSCLEHGNVNGGHMGEVGERVSKSFSKTGKIFGKYLINQMKALNK